MKIIIGVFHYKNINYFIVNIDNISNNLVRFYNKSVYSQYEIVVSIQAILWYNYGFVYIVYYKD